jgi:hypothetical protein
MLYLVKAPHFTAGLTLDDQRNVDFAAPILRWTIGKPLSFLENYCKRKEWVLEYVDTSK